MWKCGACEAMMWKWRMRKSRVRVFCAHARIVHDYTLASCRLPYRLRWILHPYA